jgi:RimJ/RimL family protein N-acetyltransferase
MQLTIRFATVDDRRTVYEWATHSDLTSSMMGPPAYPDAPVPTWEEFCSDYQSHFFDGSQPNIGRSFIIDVDGKPVGHINYDRMDELQSFAELDIWMRDSSCCGHGWGTQAIMALCEHLHSTFAVNEFILRPSARNVRAIRSYERAGFTRLPLTNDEQAAIYGPGDYRDTVVLQRLMPTLGEQRR